MSSTGLPWWKAGAIYQIAVASFADSNGDGIGDLRGIIGKLDYLSGGESSLGVDAIWLTPIMTSPLRDFGYDVTDYRSVDPRFGTMEDLEELISACHERGLRVMLDMVLNHTSDEHPWFLDSRSARDSAKRDWYVWRDGREAGTPPNGWRSVIEDSAWEYDEATDQYYYHAFLPFQPDLNWRNDDVRREMLDVVAFWLGKGADGCRLDLVNFLYEDEELRDNPRRLGLRSYDQQRHVYDRSRPESVEQARELRRLADGFDDRALMGEVYTDNPSDAIEFLGDGTDALHLAFYLDFTARPWSAEGYRASVEWLEAQIPADAWPCYYLNNHDLPRTYGRLGGRMNAEAKARLTATMLLTLRGTPILYYGEELGMPPSKIPKHRLLDPLGKKFWPLPVGRDASRTPMQWGRGGHAGFTDGEPWLPVDPCGSERNVETELADADSLLNWYRRMLQVRADSRALRAGSYRSLEGAPRGVFAYVRQAGDERALVMLNFASRTRVVDPAGESGEAATWRVLVSTHRTSGAPVENGDDGRITLAPYEATLLVPVE